MNVEHRRLHRIVGNQAVGSKQRLAAINERHIGAGATDIESHQIGKACHPPDFSGAVGEFAFISKVVQGNYEAAFFNIYSSPDPDQNYYFWSESTAKGVGQISLNFTELTNPEMQASLQVGRQRPEFETRKKAYDNVVVNQINANAVNIWTVSTPYSLIASPKVHGLKEASEVPFGNFQPKTWFASLWLSS